MNEIGGFRIHFPEFKVLKNIEDFSDVNTAGTGRGEANHGVASIAVGYWFAEFCLIFGEIRSGKDASILFHPVPGSAGKGAAVKPVDPLLGNITIGLGQI